MNLQDIVLNENQQQAVEWTGGPLLVLAGPGSGKTMVLTLKVARIIQDNPNTSVLALTFTSKAADEMRERLDKIMGERADRAHLCTFHSFAGDILRQHGSHVGIRPDFSLITLEEDRLRFLEMLFTNSPTLSLNEEKPVSNELGIIRKQLQLYADSIPVDPQNKLELLDRLFAESYTGETSVPFFKESPPWLPLLFNAYCKIMQESNRLDYGGLIHFAKKLLEEKAGVAHLTRLAWNYICVDEFQDTNRAQYDFLRLLAPVEHPNLFVVADDDQIIYQWNGASPERLRTLRSDYKMAVVQLPENYRCPPLIVKLASNLIRQNRSHDIDKQPLIARKPEEIVDSLIILEYLTDDQEMDAISSLIQEKEWVPEECVVLARSMNLLRKAAISLERNGYSPYLPIRKNEFECSSIRFIYAALRLTNARHDREYLRRICVAWQDFTGDIVEMKDVEAASTLVGGDFLRAWISIALNRLSDFQYQELLEKLHRHLVDRLEFVELINWFWCKDWLDDPLEVEERNTWVELHDALIREHALENVTLNLYLQEMDLKSKVAVRSPGSIPCLTVHGAKGLEFKHVFLVGLGEDIFPSYHAVKKGPFSREMEEERRSCFVALTRAKESLCISYAQRYRGYKKAPSRFISEMGIKVQ